VPWPDPGTGWHERQVPKRPGVDEGSRRRDCVPRVSGVRVSAQCGGQAGQLCGPGHLTAADRWRRSGLTGSRRACGALRVLHLFAREPLPSSR